MHKKIRSKILSVILLTSLIPLIGLGTASLGLLSGMKNNALEAINNLGSAVSEESTSVHTAQQNDLIDRAINAAEMSVEGYVSMAIVFIVLTLYLVLVLDIILSIRFSKTISQPISLLMEETGEIGKGNLDRTITVLTGDELEELAHAFNMMTEELKIYMKDFEKMTADKERIATELSVATSIQASIVPHIFPPFPEHKEFDLFAYMQPAKEVGGDFYDFFFADEDTLAVVMADVSGKGVPAALFMVIAKTLIKNNAQRNKTPAQVFNEVNNVLCESNEDDMFVTCFMGWLNIKTGVFDYVNAGHNPPAIKRKDGMWELMPCKPGFVLAGMEDMVYTPQSIVLESGDMIYMYTDGVTEAMDQVDDLYTERRLLLTLNRDRTFGLNDTIKNVRNDIIDFSNGVEQADDITMLILKYFGG